MSEKLHVVAVIPARGGSKRLPGKNIKDFHGKPLINWSVEAALACDLIDTVVVNSDSDDILDAVYSTDVILDKRDPALGSDTATSVDVALDVLTRLGACDVLVWLQPTSPLRTETHITEALMLLMQEHNDSVVSVCETEHSTSWMNTLTTDNKMAHFMANLEPSKRSQELEKSYLINGAIFIVKQSRFKETKRFIDADTAAYIMPRCVSIDIDDETDFCIAKALKTISKTSTCS